VQTNGTEQGRKEKREAKKAEGPPSLERVSVQRGPRGRRTQSNGIPEDTRVSGPDRDIVRARRKAEEKKEPDERGRRKTPKPYAGSGVACSFALSEPDHVEIAETGLEREWTINSYTRDGWWDPETEKSSSPAKSKGDDLNLTEDFLYGGGQVSGTEEGQTWLPNSL